jgi:hypothetical protein
VSSQTTKQRGLAVVIQNPDGSLVRERGLRRLDPEGKHTFYTELPRHRLGEQGTLMDQLFSHAFDVLDAHHIEVRVLDPDD